MLDKPSFCKWAGGRKGRRDISKRSSSPEEARARGSADTKFTVTAHPRGGGRGSEFGSPDSKAKALATIPAFLEFNVLTGMKVKPLPPFLRRMT